MDDRPKKELKQNSEENRHKTCDLGLDKALDMTWTDK